MAKEAVFTMKLEAELRAAFVKEAAGEDRPASQAGRGRSNDKGEAAFAATRNRLPSGRT